MAGVLSSEHTATAAASADDVRRGAVSSRELARGLVRLKWTLWKRSYRKNVGKIVGTSIGVLYALGGLVGLFFAMLTATVWSGEGEAFPLIVRGLGTVAVLAWLLIPLVAFGMDDTLDARAFAPYPRSARELQPGMFAAAAISLPSLLTMVAVAIATVFEVIWLLVFGSGILPVVLALLVLLPANAVGVGLCLLLPRAAFAHSASRASSRTGRELGGVIGMILFLVVVYGFSLGMQKITDIDAQALLGWVRTAIAVLTWTPVGAPFSIPMDVAEGHLLTALLRALITAATVVVVWLWWRRSLDTSLTSALVGDASSGSTKVTALVPRFVPSNAVGAVMGRSLRYWRRDTRYLAAIGIYPVVIVFFLAMGLMLPESRPMMLAMVIVMCGFMGITVCNEIGFDGPSGWVNITASLPARANLLGRVAAMALLMVPVTVLFTIVVPIVYGVPELIPLTVMCALGVQVTGWGASVVIGTLMPYPTAPPGTNPMKDKSASSSNAMLNMGLTMAVLAVPQLPAAGLAVWGVLSGSLLIQLIAGIVSLLVGAVVFLVGLRIGTVRLEAHYPDLFQKVRAYL
ncbi:hypothetical protein ACXET9_15775 [Brachybacterium sp. DNPG3]